MTTTQNGLALEFISDFAIDFGSRAEVPNYLLNKLRECIDRFDAASEQLAAASTDRDRVEALNQMAIAGISMNVCSKAISHYVI